MATSFVFESRQYSKPIEEGSNEMEDDSPFLARTYAELGQRDEALAVAGSAVKNTTVPVVMTQTAIWAFLWGAMS
jgi:hypothetical protein